MPSDVTYKRRCMVEGCPQYGVWETLEPGQVPPETNDPRNHYQQHHYGRDSKGRRLVADASTTGDRL